MTEKDLFNAIGEIDDDLITEERTMKSIKFTKAIRISAIAAAIVVFAGISTWAGSKIVGQGGSTSSIPDYYDVPSQETLINDIGIAPAVVNEFSNGYMFKSGHISKNFNLDEDGHREKMPDGLSVVYKLDDSRVSYSAEPGDTIELSDNAEIADTYNGIELNYSKWMNKFVPADYEQTEQDKEDEASGKYVFSYGTDSVEIMECQFIGWVQDGIKYSLTGIDISLTEEDFVNMAHELIDASGK